MNFKNLEKCDILKNASKIYFSQNFKCFVLPIALTFDTKLHQNPFSSKKHIFAFFALDDRYSNLFPNADINRHAHTEYLKMIEVYSSLGIWHVFSI